MVGASLMQKLWAVSSRKSGMKRGRPRAALCRLHGGEPLLQLDPVLIDAMHRAQFEIAIESNGTIRAPDGIDWICVSPKPGPETIQTRGDELKLIFPQENMDPARFFRLGVPAFLSSADGWTAL